MALSFDGSNDSYSDLDLILIFSSNENRDRAYAERRNFIRSILPYLSAKSFDASHVKPYMHVALYSNGAKVDISFETVDLQPSFQLRDLRILKDSEGWAADFLEVCAAQPPSIERSAAAAAALSDLDERFWIMFMDVYRLLLRGDHDKPFPIHLQLIYFTIPTLLDLLPQEHPARQALIDIHYSKDTTATLSHLRRLMTAYMGAREAVVKQHQLYFSIDAGFERELLKKIEGS